MKVSPELQCKLEAAFGPDPLNPCADLSIVSHGIMQRIRTLQAEIDALKITFNNILPAMDRLIAEERNQ